MWQRRLSNASNMSSYRGIAPSFIYKIDYRFPKTGDLKSSGKKYTLETRVTKLIVYSSGVTKMNVTTWRMSPDEDVAQRTETWEVKPGMNVICLCRYRMTEEWADEYFRVQIGVHRYKCISFDFMIWHLFGIYLAFYVDLFCGNCMK